MSRCKERGGVLFNHDCKNEGDQRCHRCKKHICGSHTRTYQQQPTCVSCVREALRGQQGRGPNTFAADPHFFFFYGGRAWDTEPYDADDYDLFDQAPAAAAMMVTEDAWEGS